MPASSVRPPWQRSDARGVPCSWTRTLDEQGHARLTCCDARWATLQAMLPSRTDAAPSGGVELLFAVSEQPSGSERAVYTRDSLASALRLMGTKPRHSVKVAARVFDALDALSRSSPAGGGHSPAAASPRGLLHRLPRAAARQVVFGHNRSAVLPRPQFDSLVAWALADFQYTKPDQLDVLRLACRHELLTHVGRRGCLTRVFTPHSIHERRRGIILLLCGTSGTGKSTLATLLARARGVQGSRLCDAHG